MASQQQKEEQEWENVTEKRIQAAFRLFDKENKGVVNQEEVPYIMRYLGVYPSEEALVKEILPEMQDDEPTAFVTYPKLKAVLLRLMKTREVRRGGETRARSEATKRCEYNDVTGTFSLVCDSILTSVNASSLPCLLASLVCHSGSPTRRTSSFRHSAPSTRITRAT